jgi:hypothetical protein
MKQRSLSSRCFRGFCFFLFCGGIATVVCEIISFFLRLGVPYFFYKNETITYIIYVVRYIIFLLMYGLRHIETVGYLDEYDNVTDSHAYVNYIGGVMGLASIVPIFCSFGVNVLLPLFWVMFYSPISFVYTFINGTAYSPESRLNDYLLLIVTSLAMLVVTALLLYPFYKLGRRNCRRDRENKVKVKIVE